MKIFLLIILLFSTNALAKESDQAMANAAMNDLNIENSRITKAQYDDFWNKAGAKNRKEKEQTILLMKDNFLSIQDYQREVWKCAEQAWNSKKISKCNGSEAKLKLLQANFKKNNQEDAMMKFKESSEAIIKAAANRGKYTPTGGKEVQMSLELIKTTRNNLDKIFSKFEQILKVDY